MASASCTLFCSVSHFILISMIVLIQYSESCPEFYCSCPDNVYNGQFLSSNITSAYQHKVYHCGGHCELRCNHDNHTMMECGGSDPSVYRVLDVNPTNLTLALDYPDWGLSDLCNAYSDLKSSFPFLQSVSLSIKSSSGENQVFYGCPFPQDDDIFRGADFSACTYRYGQNNVTVYGPYDYDHHIPQEDPPSSGCIKFSTQYSPSGTGAPWKFILRFVLSVIAFDIAVFIVIIIYWRRRNNKSSLKPSPSRIMSLNHTRSDLEEGSITNGVAVFSYAELQQVTNDFDPSRELGEGGFGVVYHGKLRDGREVAVKRMFEKNYKQIEQFKNEIQILTNVRHPNLVTLYGSTSRDSRELLLVYEFIPNGTLSDHLHGDQSKSVLLLWPARLKIAIQTASALCYLHHNDIIHRDIKSNNILLDKSFVAKVADFGLSRLFPSDVSHVSTAPQGTPGYLDPEYHQCYHLTDRSDVYSFGVVLVELISSMEAVDFERERHEVNLASYAMNRIQGCEFGELVDVNLGYDKSFKVRRMTTLMAELAFRCLQHEREIRPSMEEVLEALKCIQTLDYDGLETQEMG